MSGTKVMAQKNILPPKSAFYDSQEQDNSGKKIFFYPCLIFPELPSISTVGSVGVQPAVFTELSRELS